MLLTLRVYLGHRLVIASGRTYCVCAEAAMAACEVCVVVGTSSEVFPAAQFAPRAAARGAVVAEFNLLPTAATRKFHYYFEGPCGTTLPLALAD